MPGAGADPSRSEPESAPGPWRPGAGAGAAQKSGGSATLAIPTYIITGTNVKRNFTFYNIGTST